MIQNKIRLLSRSEIKVEDRQRKDIDPAALQELMDSIVNHSLIHPILVDTEGDKLIAGERRLQAFDLAERLNLPCPDPAYENWTKIPVRYAHKVTPEEIYEIELSENVARQQLSWEETAAAIVHIHNKKLSANKNWTQRDTGRLIGISQSFVSNALSVGKVLSSTDEKLSSLVKKASGIKSAARLIERSKSREEGSILDVAFQRPKLEVPKASGIDLINADFNEWAKSYSGPPFNFLHLDFPYGIDLDKSEGQRSIQDRTQYKDSPEVLSKLLTTLSVYQEKLIAPSAHIMFWFSQKHRGMLESFFTNELEGSVEDHLMIWHCNDNGGLLPSPEYYGRRNYETAMLISFENRKIVRPVSLCYSHPKIFPGKVHRSEKPVDVLRHFFQMFVDSSTIFGDFTCGSGTSLFVARELKAKYILGLEIDKEIFEQAEASLDNPIGFFSDNPIGENGEKDDQ